MKSKSSIFLAILLASMVLLLTGKAEQDSRSRAGSVLKEWEVNYCFSKDYSELQLSGDIYAEIDSADYWQKATKDLNGFPRRDDVKKVVCNNGIISGAFLEFLSHFPELEDLTLGFSIEGVTITPEHFRPLLKFAKLKTLKLAVHGLNNEHLKILSGHKNLREINIGFGVKEMVADGVLKNGWQPVKIDDEGAAWLSRIKTLESLSFRWPEREVGEVSFSEKALISLRRNPALKYIAIDTRNFTSQGIKAVRLMNLPGSVIINVM